ncbi:DUF6402 family protein [Cupriavidus pauculus]|uniref:DUF6402 family protein n=1 Tax=Cupriavidus pauculus TaxID=82633 RepID=UPI001246E070|nr:DUF6402 family protein [Cupriavidus pauculus]KAB0603112.1 hypothetical protein F7R19_09025 [Cupriavidus pauculus]MCM3604644.1 DUF6402 family protein [Cupriavidus pauculus]UAK98687.1 DUF6402 family protein [Cupriavidus pauculus]
MSFEGAKEFKAPQPYIRNKLDPILAIERRWKLYDGRRACTPMDIKDFGLSLHKAPPPLFDWSYYTAQPRGADSTDTAKASKAEHPPPVTARPTYRFFDSAPAQQARGLAPFDLYDLPAAMRAEDFPVAAQFAERWFHGRRFNAHRYDAKKRTYVEGRYDPDMIDTKTIRLKWLFRFGRVRERYDELLRKLDTRISREALRKNLEKFLQTEPQFTGVLDTFAYCRGDLQKLHSEFQYQYVGVGMQHTLSHAPVSGGKWLPIGMTDLSAALGRFNFYAAIAQAELSREQLPRTSVSESEPTCYRVHACITHVHLYMRDSYSFQDSHRSSQYLGHWNKRGLVVLPVAALAHFLSDLVEEGSWLDVRLEPDDTKLLPVAIKDRLEPESVYYPVRNRDFRAWQAEHNRGGDFLIYSDFATLRLSHPIHVDLEKQC